MTKLDEKYAGEPDDRPVTLGEFREWRQYRAHSRAKSRNRLAILFLMLGVLAALGIYLSMQANNETAKVNKDLIGRLERNAREDTYRTCIAGGQLRVVVAVGFDSLRRTAIGRVILEDETIRQFILRTQPVIDALLSQAAGLPFITPFPPGEVTPAIVRAVLRLSRRRCERRVEQTFDNKQQQLAP